MTRQKYIFSKRDGKTIKEDYILSLFFQTNIFYYYTKNLNELFNNFQIMITRFDKHLRIIVFLFLQIVLYQLLILIIHLIISKFSIYNHHIRA